MFKHPQVTIVILFSLLASSLIAAGNPVPAVSAAIPPALVFTPVVSGLTQPVFVTNAGDGSNRLFIVERGGQIRIFKGGGLLAMPFLDVSGVPGFIAAGSEQGLLGLAFDPNYSSNRRFYITYTVSTGDPTFKYRVVLARYQASASDPDVADAASRFPILGVQKKYSNHNGGMVAFGPDGYLYWGIGDGGSGGDPDNNAQNLQSRLGKILRLDVQTTPPAGKTYVIPPSNPFFGSSTARQEIWAYGLRNPWRFSFDRSTGSLFIGDVGQNIQEEIDFQPASSAGGENYGWHVLEGNLCYTPSNGCTPPANYVPPVAVYNHGTNDSYGCAVTGGYAYRGSAFPGMQGVYFYGDYCTGKILGLVKGTSGWSHRLIVSTSYSISSFGEDEAGELYLTDYGGGRVIGISPVSVVTAPAFVSQASLDGTVIETGENSGAGGTTDAAGQTLTVGDTLTRRQRRAILSFDTSGLPDNAVITSARVRVKLSSMTSPDPFTVLGKLTVDLGVPRFGTQAALESLDFQATATRSDAGAFGSTPSAGWYIAPVANASLASINRAGRTQFRLRFTLDDDNDSAADYAAFFSGNAATAADRPRLVIQYYVP